MTPRKAGFEAGIQRQLPRHPYMMGSTPAREFMAGFQAGRERRAWLDARGQRRTRTVIERDPAGGWRWEFLIENTMHGQGWQRTEKAASQAAEAAAMDAADAGLTRTDREAVPAVSALHERKVQTGKMNGACCNDTSTTDQGG